MAKRFSLNLPETKMSEEQQRKATDALQSDSLAILDQLDWQWIRETEAAIRASEEPQSGDCLARFLETGQVTA